MPAGIAKNNFVIICLGCTRLTLPYRPDNGGLNHDLHLQAVLLFAMQLRNRLHRSTLLTVAIL